MTDTTDFEAKRDIADIAVERYKQGRLTRRGFIAAMGALGTGILWWWGRRSGSRF